MWLYYYHNDSLLSALSFMLNLPYFLLKCTDFSRYVRRQQLNRISSTNDVTTQKDKNGK